MWEIRIQTGNGNRRGGEGILKYCGASSTLKQPSVLFLHFLSFIFKFIVIEMLEIQLK